VGGGASGTDATAADPDDPWAAVIAAQRYEVADDDDAGDAIGLETAMLHVEHHFPSSFYCPSRWDTADGCMPYKLVWVFFAAKQGQLGLDALAVMRGIGMAFAEPDAAREGINAALKAAFPTERR
jgi:hypothetical protein